MSNYPTVNEIEAYIRRASLMSALRRAKVKDIPMTADELRVALGYFRFERVRTTQAGGGNGQVHDGK